MCEHLGAVIRFENKAVAALQYLAHNIGNDPGISTATHPQPAFFDCKSAGFACVMRGCEGFDGKTVQSNALPVSAPPRFHRFCRLSPDVEKLTERAFSCIHRYFEMPGKYIEPFEVIGMFMGH